LNYFNADILTALSFYNDIPAGLLPYEKDALIREFQKEIPVDLETLKNIG
jgi:hypothetical protein